jgi:uncharacterized protein (UPF0264 family)
MLDTAGKGGGSLTNHLGLDRLASFIANAHRSGLVAGLAGSLRLADVAALAPLGADYLGFRSALTHGGRAGELDLVLLRELRAALQPAASSSATATEGALSLAVSATSGAAPATAPNAR